MGSPLEHVRLRPTPLVWSEQHLTRDLVATDLTRHTAWAGVEGRLQFEIDVPDAFSALAAGSEDRDPQVPFEVWCVEPTRARARRLGRCATLVEAKALVERLHVEDLVRHHHQLDWRDLRAARRAWPREGLARFAGAESEMVRAELARARGGSRVS